MLRVVHGNRFEQLADALIQALPAADPFAPSTVVVSRGLVGAWLTYRIADARGIACGVELPFLDRFLAEAYVDAEAAAAGLRGLRRDQLAAVLASVLADPDQVRDGALARVRDYLGDPTRPDAPVRRIQLAQRVSGLYWSYAMTRPELLAAWDAGTVYTGSERGASEDARWQARLWAMADAHKGGSAVALVPRLPYARRRLGLGAPRLAQPVHVVGFSYLAPAYLDALADLATAQDVTIYLVDPCADFWEDVRRAGTARSAAERLLALWGKPIRDTNAALIERTGGDFDGRFVEPARDSALAALVADVVTRSPTPTPAPTPTPGIQVLACPSVRRELEVVGSEIVQLLAARPELRANDVAVLIAGEPDDYLAQLPAVWSALLGAPPDGDVDDAPPGLPFHVVESQLAEHGRVGEAIDALLDLPLGRFTRRELLGVMTHPCVLARHRHVDPDDWVQWTERLGVVHGADRGDHRGTYLDGLDLFHWDQGILRLALGGFMCGDRPGVPLAPDRSPGPADHRPEAPVSPSQAAPVGIGKRSLIPEEVPDDRQASAATFALLARSLIGDARWLRGCALPLADWARVLDGVVTTYIYPPDDAGARELARVRSEIIGLGELDLDGRAVEYREVVELVRHRLGKVLGDRGEPLAHGVMVAPLAPMRPLPFAVVFVVGLAEGRFPANEPASPLDLRDPPRPGEVSARDRDRTAFLDAVLAARDRLVLSYGALDAKTGEPIAPSPVVLELADALAPYLGVESGAAALAAITARHPLYRWDPAYAANPALTPSPAPARARERRSVVLREAITAHLRKRGESQPDTGRLRELITAAPALAEVGAEIRVEPVIAPAAAEPTDAPVRISLPTVRKFLEAPVQAWAAAVLRLGELPDEELIDKSDEPFGHDPAGRAEVLRETLALVLGVAGAPLPVEPAHAAAIAGRIKRGAAPVGVFGEVAGALDRKLIEQWRAALEPYACDGAARASGRSAQRIAYGRSQTGDATLAPAIELDVDLGGRPRRIELVGQTEILLAGQAGASTSVVVCVSKKANRRHSLRGAIDHLALAATAPAPVTHRTVCLDASGGVHVVDHAAWEPAAARAFLADLIGELLARPHGYLLDLEEADHALAGKEVKVREARDENPGSLGYGPIRRIERLGLPPNPLAIAQRRLAPLVDRMRGDHGFDGGDA